MARACKFLFLIIAAGSSAHAAPPPNAADVASFEAGFAKSCNANFPSASPIAAGAACTCLLHALYGGEAPQAVLPRALTAKATGHLPADLTARLADAQATCSGDVLAAEFQHGCAAGCVGDSREMARCDALCTCIVTDLRNAHPGDAGARWLVTNAYVETPTGPAATEIEAYATSCVQAAARDAAPSN